MRPYWLSLLVIGLFPCSGSVSAQSNTILEDTYDGLFYGFLSPTRIEFVVSAKGVFPNPPARAVVTIDCLKGNVVEGAADLKAYLKNRSYAKIASGVFNIRDFYVGCENGAVFAKSPSITLTLAAMDGSGDLNGSRQEQGLTIRIFDGYRYPNIKEGFYYSDLKLTIAPGVISAEDSDDSGPAITPLSTVGIMQNEKTSPVLYEGQSTEGSYDPSQPLVIFYNLGELAQREGWHSLTVRYNLGKLVWRKIVAPPK